MNSLEIHASGLHDIVSIVPLRSVETTDVVGVVIRLYVSEYEAEFDEKEIIRKMGL
jgi:hypothetical protein